MFKGYLALHLLGLAIGTLILPPSPSHFRRAVSGLNSTGTDSPAASRAPSPTRLHVDNDLHMGRRPPTPDSSDDDEPRQKFTPAQTYQAGGSQDEPRKRGKAAIELCSYAVVWWTLYLIGSTLGGGTQGVSRRLVRAETLFLRWNSKLTSGIEPTSRSYMDYPQPVSAIFFIFLFHLARDG